MKMTALEFTTQFLIQKLRSIPTESRSSVLQLACYENWPDFIVAIQLNKNDLVDWLLTELGQWKGWKGCDEFNFKSNIVDDGFKTGEGDFFIFEFDGKFIKVSYSDFQSMCFQTIEFDFVEQVEILVPTKTWQIIK